MRKNERKQGFTLVELIVVLVILAILAAMLIPALTGYIDKAQEKRLLAECRACVSAAQTLASERYALGAAADGNYAEAASALELSEVDGLITEMSFDPQTAKLDSLTYERSGKTVTYLALPYPHYEFGSAASSLTPEQLGEGVGEAISKINGIDYLKNKNFYSTDPLSPKNNDVHKLFIDALPPAVRAELSDKVWTVAKKGDSFTLIVYDGSPEGLKSGVAADVSLYDGKSGAISQGKRYTGTSNGKIIIPSY